MTCRDDTGPTMDDLEDIIEDMATVANIDGPEICRRLTQLLSRLSVQFNSATAIGSDSPPLQPTESCMTAGTPIPSTTPTSLAEDISQWEQINGQSSTKPTPSLEQKSPLNQFQAIPQQESSGESSPVQIQPYRAPPPQRQSKNRASESGPSTSVLPMAPPPNSTPASALAAYSTLIRSRTISRPWVRRSAPTPRYRRTFTSGRQTYKMAARRWPRRSR